MKVYFQNYTEKIGVPTHKPLYASAEQALEIFAQLPQNDGSFLGIVNNRGKAVQFTKYNKFVWLVEVPVPDKKGNYQIFLTPNRCKNLIRELFKGLNPLMINGLRFEGYG